jgi:hypothetical protein
LEEVRAWLGVSVTQISNHDLEVIRVMELSNQWRECRVPPELAAAGLLPPDLIGSAYRRCARSVAARGIPLGYRQGDDEYGPMRVTSWDAEISRIEGPLRRFAFG